MVEEKLGQLLIKNQLIDQKTLDFALAVQNTHRQQGNSEIKIGEILVDYNLVLATDIVPILAGKKGMGFFDGEYVLHMEVVRHLGGDFLLKHYVFPLKKEVDGKICFVLKNVDCIEVTDAIRRIINEKLKHPVKFYLGVEKKVLHALSSFIQNKHKKIDFLKHKKQEQDENYFKILVEKILDSAIRLKATDIHFEPSDKILIIRFRIDGVKSFQCCFDISYIYRIANVLFVKCGIDSNDHRRPHDGSFEHKADDGKFDTRMSFIPGGIEKGIVLRLLDKEKISISLQSLGYCEEHWQQIVTALRKPTGIILVTGQTGSGKTTTLYSMLNRVKGLGVKVITIEDPIEMPIPLVFQIEVGKKNGITFQEAIKYILRHDPDKIMIGEIRDLESLKTAITLSVTGHQVFSTLHTSSAFDTLIRLRLMGIDYTYLSNVLNCLIAQRLVRKLCLQCKIKVELSKVKQQPFAAHGSDGANAYVEEHHLKYLNEDTTHIFIENGCQECDGTGFWGRTVVAEVLVINDAIRPIIQEGNITELREYARNDPTYISMDQDMKRLINRGVTTLEEAVRVLG